MRTLYIGQFHRLGHGKDQNVNTPKKVNLPESIQSVSVGAFHVLCVSHSGKVYGWGDNEKHQVVVDSIDSAPKPILIIGNDESGTAGAHPDQGQITKVNVAAGPAQSVCWKVKKIPNLTWKTLESIPKQCSLLENWSAKQICLRRLVLTEFSNDLVNHHFYQFGDLEELNIPNLLTSIPKENLLRRLITQSMYRERQHGPTIQINRVVKQPPKPSDPQWMGSVTWQIINEVVKEANY